MGNTLFDFIDRAGQAAVAKTLGLSVSTVNRIYNGKIGISDAVHIVAIKEWPGQYDAGGSTVESLRRQGDLPRASASGASDALQAIEARR